MQWAVNKEKLSSQQERVMDELLANLHRPQWLRGFAGSGKTILMTLLVERLCAVDPNGSICFISYTHALKDLVNTGFHGDISHRVEVMTYHAFLKENRKCKYVFVDEVQDIPISKLDAIRSLSGHLLIAGDPDQGIYKVDCSERQILELLAPRVSTLGEIFRLTQTLLDAAVSIYPPAAESAVGVDVVGGKDSTIRLASCATSKIESVWTWQQALDLSSPGKPVAILLPSHQAIGDFARDIAAYLELPAPEGAQSRERNKDYVLLNRFWHSNQVPLMYLGNGFGSLPASDRKPLVYLMTLHSVKGLDFDNVFLPRMAENNLIWGKDGKQEDAELLKRLLFVAATRSRSNLTISFSGKTVHEAFSMMPEHLLNKVQINEASLDSNEDDDFEGWV